MPWLLTVAAFALYWFTLNRWVSPANFMAVAKISGWTWQSEVAYPIFFLVTYPFRWLPPAQIPVALNVFSAACAALTLGLLARSVALLPQDRTDAQRKREHSDFSFLTIGSAWLPPVLAVLVCGLQMTFWQNATNCTGEMFDLLLFAFAIWSLLEYRLDERDGRLFLASFVYGAGMANNWAMVGFFPAYVTAVVWIRGLSFLKLRFLKRMLLCGLLGMMFYLLLPLLGVISGKFPMTSWQIIWGTLKANLAPQYDVLKFIFACCLHPQRPSHLAIIALFLAYLMPVFMMAIRWKASFGDHSQMGLALTSFLFHLAHAVFFVLCVWMAFDPPFSPRKIDLGTPCLTFYYLGALCIGYFCGYFLLIFGKAPSSRMHAPRPDPFQFLDPLVIVGVWVLAVAILAGLVYRNTPQIRAANDDTFKKYASFMEENLPRAGGVLLSDDPFHLFLVEAALTRDGRAKDFLPLETQSLKWPAYLRFLHDKFPQKWPKLVSAKEMKTLNPLGLIGALTMLARSNELCYLHPSFGYYFEQFYQEPHGLVYKLKILPGDTLLPPLPDKDQIAGNNAFWARVEAQAFAPVKRAVTPPDQNAPRSLGVRMLDEFHVPREQNQNAILAGTFYSRSLNFWGVQLQYAGDLTNAAAYFTRAEEVNPDNFVAQINLRFNQSLRAGKSVPLDLSQTTSDEFGKYRDWNGVLTANGPFDEPSFCFVEGINLGSLRQAVAPLTRVRELVPDNLLVRLTLAQIYVQYHLPDRALDALRDPLEHPERFSLARTSATQLNVLAAAAYLQKGDPAQATQLLDAEVDLHPDDANLLNAVAQTYLMHGLFPNALKVVDRRLQLAPEDPDWLFKRGYVAIQLKAYDDAIAAFTRALAARTNNPSVLFDRALACLYSGKLDAARADYKTLQQTFTNSFQVAFGLGEIAWRQHDTNEAIRNYKLYLANANTNTAEATNVIQRLRELNGHSP
ncbi:MAG: tetratricopeptide repeat protein [Verrucomicrobiota bacterium]